MTRTLRPTMSPPSRSTRPRATVVTLVLAVHGRHHTVAVRSLRTGHVYFSCRSTDTRGAALAVLAAERYCAERGFVVVMAANDTGSPPRAA